jgi:hypothetical protein
MEYPLVGNTNKGFNNKEFFLNFGSSIV